MKNKFLKKSLALICALTFILCTFAACNRNGNQDETEKPTIEVAPEVKLKGKSSIALLDRGEKPIVKIGPFDISADFISTYIKKKIIDSSTQPSALAAAYEIAAIFYAERSIAGTERELTAQQVQGAIDRQEQDFEHDREVNLVYCEIMGLRPEEFMDFISIGELQVYVGRHHSELVHEYLEESYKNRLAYDGRDESFSNEDLAEYYPEYMKAVVRWLDIKHLSPGALDELNEEIDAWAKEYVTA